MYFDPADSILTSGMGYEIHLCNDFSSVDFIYLIPIFSRIVWIDKMQISLTKVAMEIGNRHYFSYHNNDC